MALIGRRLVRSPCRRRDCAPHRMAHARAVARGARSRIDAVHVAAARRDRSGLRAGRLSERPTPRVCRTWRHRESAVCAGLGAAEAIAIPGTEDAAHPFWSPDSASLGFFAKGRLMKVALKGGAPAALAEALFPFGGTWSASGTIVFAPDVIMTGLFRVGVGGARSSVRRCWIHHSAILRTAGRYSCRTAFTSSTSCDPHRRNGAVSTSAGSIGLLRPPIHSCCDRTRIPSMSRCPEVPTLFSSTSSTAALKRAASMGRICVWPRMLARWA